MIKKSGVITVLKIPFPTLGRLLGLCFSSPLQHFIPLTLCSVSEDQQFVFDNSSGSCQEARYTLHVRKRQALQSPILSPHTVLAGYASKAHVQKHIYLLHPPLTESFNSVKRKKESCQLTCCFNAGVRGRRFLPFPICIFHVRSVRSKRLQVQICSYHPDFPEQQCTIVSRDICT